MPGETLIIDPANYPKLAEIDDGEDVVLSVKGKKSTDEEGMIQIETTDIEHTNANPAKKALKEMGVGSSSMNVPESNADEDEDY